jgi:hypothetical protein
LKEKAVKRQASAISTLDAVRTIELEPGETKPNLKSVE